MAGWDHEAGLLALGSGAAGLTAAEAGLSTLVAEKSEWVGGTTARSAGTVWVPGHRQPADPRADVGEAARYLDALVGDRGRRDLRTAYLRYAPEALEHLRQLGIGFRHTAGAVDYHPEVPGAGVGRALEPEPFDGRRLGRQAFGRIRHPVREFTLLGGTLMLRRAEADQPAAAFTGETVPGLYACGDDAHSITASEYPGPGCRIGGAVTFGHLAARHAARYLREGNGLWPARRRTGARSSGAH